MMDNILFLSLSDFNSLDERNIYTDLLREFKKNGHKICAISPVERRKNEKTYIINEEGCKILKLKIGNIQKTNAIEKGINTLAIEFQFIKGIKKYFSDERFDLILYATPPVTFCKSIEYVKNRDDARSYLMLKDIFPQNAVDIGMMNKTGIKSLLYRYFRKKERRLYRISDWIGCMSPANKEYILKHNPEVNQRHTESMNANGKGIIEVCPNSVDPIDMSMTDDERTEIREKYNLPLDKTIFVYGGNLGKPQGIDFMLKCFHLQRDNKKIFFLIIGNGTEYERIERYIEKYNPKNIALHQWLPQDDYNKVVAACDVGMIFLDHRFTIPNFPSRLLSYMQAKIPVLAVTDPNTDIGKVITADGFGWWCESNDLEDCMSTITLLPGLELMRYGRKAFESLNRNYNVKNSYQIITKWCGKRK